MDKSFQIVDIHRHDDIAKPCFGMAKDTIRLAVTFLSSCSTSPVR